MDPPVLKVAYNGSIGIQSEGPILTRGPWDLLWIRGRFRADAV